MSKQIASSGDNALVKIIARLEEWADWYGRAQDWGLGYPSSSLEYRMLRGGSTSRSTRVLIQPSHEAAEEIEALVREMAQQNRPMAEALRVHYFQEGSLRQHAVQLAMSHTQFRFSLGMAHQWLVGRLSALQVGVKKC